MLSDMAQIVVRVNDELAAQLDALVEDGVVASRSEGVRRAIDRFVDEQRRAEIGRQIVEGYERVPQEGHDGLWSDEQTFRMIAEEPW